MTETGDLTLWCALNRLMSDYWADVDHNDGQRAHAFYQPDALYAVGDNRFEGVEKIRAFYARRRQISGASMRHGLTRHLISNLRVERDGAEHARAMGIMTLYRAEGKPPFHPVTPPAMLADFEARCVLAGDRVWRFQSHLLQPVFVGDDPPMSMLLDPQRL